MTREEAKDIKSLWFEEYVKYSTVCNVIDTIYDDFESRTCESCKHWNYDLVSCNKLPFIRDIDFGCNKWEKKDD